MRRQLEAIWLEHRGELKSFILRRVRSPSEAEDILQDVFLKMLASLDSVHRMDHLRAWLFTVARNAVTDHFRRKRPMGELPDDLADQCPDPESDLLEAAGSCLTPLLSALPEKIREALVMADLEGVKQREVAQRLGISLAAVKSRVLRGRIRIRQMIEDCCHLELDARGNVMDYIRKPNGRSFCDPDAPSAKH